jgi:hypothetical protein
VELSTGGGSGSSAVGVGVGVSLGVGVGVGVSTAPGVALPRPMSRKTMATTVNSRTPATIARIRIVRFGPLAAGGVPGPDVGSGTVVIVTP